MIFKFIFTCLVLVFSMQNCIAGYLLQETTCVAFNGSNSYVECIYSETNTTKSVRLYFLPIEDDALESPIKFRSVDNESEELFLTYTIYDSEKEEFKNTIFNPESIPVNAIFRGKMVYLFNRNSELISIDVSAQKQIWSKTLSAPANNFILDNGYLFVAQIDGKLEKIEIKKGTTVKSIEIEKTSENWLIKNKNMLVISNSENNTRQVDLESMDFNDFLFRGAYSAFINEKDIFCIDSSGRMMIYNLDKRELSKSFGTISSQSKRTDIYGSDTYEVEKIEIKKILPIDERFIAIEIDNDQNKYIVVDLVSHLQWKYSELSKCKNCSTLLQASESSLTTTKGVIKVNEINIARQETFAPTIQINDTSLVNDVIVCSGDYYILKGIISDESKISQLVLNDEEIIFSSESGQFNGLLFLKTDTLNVSISCSDIYRNTSVKNIQLIRKKLTRGGSVSNNDTLYNKMSAFTYHAIFIASETYIDPAFGKLEFPVSDSKKIMNLLEDEFTFDSIHTTLLINPTRNKIINSFDSLLNILTPNDHLLIFYAGHGVYDEKLKQGYWLPADADVKNKGTWVSNNDIRDYVGAIDAGHILLISDACFSGSIFEFNREIKTEYVIDQLLTKKARMAMTSGLDNPVPDKSLFLQYLLKGMIENNKPYIKAGELFNSLQDAVISNTDNLPQYGVIKSTNHEGGEFLFLKRF